MKYMSWEEYTTLCDKLSKEVSEEGINAVVGINRGGLIIGGIIAHRLGVPLYPVFVEHREFEEEHSPVVPEDLGKIKAIKSGTILLTEDLVYSGKCISFVKSQFPKNVTLKSLAVVCHKSAKEKSDYVGIFLNDIPVFSYDI